MYINKFINLEGVLLEKLRILRWMKEDLYLTKVLLTASKKAVIRNWLNVNTPKQEQWLEIVQEILVMEKLTYLLRLKENVFEKNWEKWNIYMRHDTN